MINLNDFLSQFVFDIVITWVQVFRRMPEVQVFYDKLHYVLLLNNVEK